MLKMTAEEYELLAELGLRLRKARVARQMTQEELGARAGLSRQTIVHMERGEPSVGLGKWIKISSLLGLAPTWHPALVLPADPFDEYDRRQRDRERLRRTRVRPK
jgi:transcriptional regulator with XRE-family HTH domain